MKGWMNMDMDVSGPRSSSVVRLLLSTLLIFLGLVAFSILFVVVDNANFRFVGARFPNVGSSAWLATWWGIASRAFLVFVITLIVVWRPRLFGFQIGKTWHYRRMLLIMLVTNCGIIAGYLCFTGSTTPYSGDQWFITEVVIVPLVEETFWRGVVITTLLLLFKKLYSDNASNHLAAWFSGLAFGLLHGNNLLAGVPLSFVAIQVLNATLWGVVYGYARTKTESIYPPIILHAAMNFTVILF
jgi:membrane protease YdiL (CAAX protease family)